MKKPSLFFHLFSKTIAFAVRLLLRTRYKISVLGADVFRESSSAFILPNHQALIDPVILVSHIYRFSTVTPVMSEKYFDIPVAKTFFRRLGAVRVSDLENGSRDTQVLKVITRSVLKGFKRKHNIILYPSGQIAGQGYEKIFNKKSAYHIVAKLPEDVRVIGVRISGLWGSMWSKAKTGKSPNFFFQLLKGLFFVLLNLIFFLPKRTVTIEFEDLTASSKSIAEQGQKPFNSFLEGFYNLNGEEAPLFLKHFFYL
ncbi:MAG: 1-acyl-sn-glycerol-3-phosphate acyltransferase [Prolixibacteraceae bacterium]|jgi:long-chain-fatty-acid--[acyl-carrier-protein] ligase|nr:1-acyl-sn-glycerol-3-phosphate acyltransferase [Prolixibacteraceae bacterium]